MDKEEIDFGETKVNTSVFQHDRDNTPKTVYEDCNFLDESNFVKESHEFSTQTIDFDYDLPDNTRNEVKPDEIGKT